MYLKVNLVNVNNTNYYPMFYLSYSLSTIEAETFTSINFHMSKKTQNIWQNLLRLEIFGTNFAEKTNSKKLSRMDKIFIKSHLRSLLSKRKMDKIFKKGKKTQSVIVVDDD